MPTRSPPVLYGHGRVKKELGPHIKKRYTGCIEEKNNMLVMRLSPDTEERLQRMAEETGRTKNRCVREALLRFLEDREDEFLALSRLKTPTKRWTLEELEKESDPSASSFS